MKIKIDDKTLEYSDDKKNIVEIAGDNGITLIAPCFRNKRQKGCCKACVIEIDGKQEYACTTRPEDGMQIVYDRKDLNELRKKRLKIYSENILNGQEDKNKCNSGNKSSGCGCSCNSGCC